MIYQMAVQQGISSAQLALTGSNAVTKAAYNRAYSAQAQRISARERRNAAERNISAIKSDKLMSNMNLQLNLNQAQAAARLNAVFAGVEGQSVDDVIFETETAAERRKAQLERQTENAIDGQLNDVNSSYLDQVGVTEQKTDPVAMLLRNLSAIDREDVKIMENM